MAETKTGNLEHLIEGIKAANPIPRGELLLCGFCFSPIATQREAFSYAGHHEYHFINPHGIGFRIACFRTAPGCSIAGTPTSEHSWFNGYHWQLAQCSDCGEHLGWYYRLDRDEFFGLIPGKLRKS